MTSEQVRTEFRRDAAHIIRAAKCLVAFTGAGISVPSGIPPFRGPAGIWTRIPSSSFSQSYWLSKPVDTWRKCKEYLVTDHFLNAQPNELHHSLATLQSKGILKSVVTQNIDRLHQKSGIKRVVQVHGTISEFYCIECRHSTTQEISVWAKETPPRCPSCDGWQRPGIVFFGDDIPERAWELATQASQSADVLLVVGTSLEVNPFASLIERQMTWVHKEMKSLLVVDVDLNTRGVRDLDGIWIHPDEFVSMVRAI